MVDIHCCGDQQDLKNILKDCKRLANEIENFPTFDVTEWDWSYAKERLKRAMRDWPSNLVFFVQDSIALLEKKLTPSIYQKKYKI